MLTTIAVDAMSGDHGALVCVPACIRFLREHSDARVLLVGDEKELGRLAAGTAGLESRMDIVHASQVVAMDDSARDAVRHKKDSSMRVAIDLVKKGDMLYSLFSMVFLLDEFEQFESAGRFGELELVVDSYVNRYKHLPVFNKY